MEQRYEDMWREYIFGRLSLDDWLKFCEKYRKYINDTYNEGKNFITK